MPRLADGHRDTRSVALPVPCKRLRHSKESIEANNVPKWFEIPLTDMARAKKFF